jgi:hypothetical protein
MRHWRKMTWLIWLWCIAIIVWAVAGGGSTASNCAHQRGDQFLSKHAAQQACDAGAGIGIAIILVIGFVGFVFLALIWLMSRPRRRDCPVCGSGVKRGLTVCPKCGHDFAAAARPQPRVETG